MRPDRVLNCSRIFEGTFVSRQPSDTFTVQNLLARSKEQSKKLLEDVAWPITPEGQARAGYVSYGVNGRGSHMESAPVSDHSNNPTAFDSPEKRAPVFEPQYSVPDAHFSSYDAPHPLRQSAPGHPAVMMQGMSDMGMGSGDGRIVQIGSFRSPSPARNLNASAFKQSSPNVPASNREMLAPQLLVRSPGAHVVFM